MRVALAVFAALLIAAPAQAAGVDVTWPAQREYAPGEQITVGIKATRAVRVTVVRTSASGRVMATVARRTLKRGTVTATLARAGSYSVRVRDGARVHTRVLRAVTPPPGGCSAATSLSVEVRLSADRVIRGGTLPYSVVNMSDGCLTTGAAYGLEYQVDGTWKPVPWELTFAMYAVILKPGESFAKSVRIPAGAPLGTYRILEDYNGFTEPTFEVVA